VVKEGPSTATPGDEIDYTIVVTNTSIGPAVTLNGRVTDTVTTSSGGKSSRDWSMAIESDNVWTRVYTYAIPADFVGAITNTVTVETSHGVSRTATVTTIVRRRVYLPLVMRNH
jgi:uncharacterized repeat protein (TIGR01451 family)